MRRFSICLTIIVVMILSACTTQLPLTIEESTSTTPKNPGYPMPSTIEAISGYPPPIQSTSAISTPTINPEKATVTITISYNNSPLAKEDFFLASLLKDSEGNETVGRIERSSAPKGTTDEKGTVIFHNVTPGRYALVFFENLTSYLLLDPSEGGPITFTLVEGETKNLGHFNFTDLPLE